MQQVNLYRQEFSSTTELPGFQQMLLACATTVILFTLFFGVQLFRMYQLDSQIAEAEVTAGELVKTFENISLSASTADGSTNEHNIDQLKTRLLYLRELTTALFNQPGDTNRQGFSNQMDGLVRQHVEGISLSNMRIFNGGQNLALQGTASPAEKAPHYLTALQSDTAFSGVDFGQLQMRRNEQNGEIDFSLHHHEADVSQ